MFWRTWDQAFKFLFPWSVLTALRILTWLHSWTMSQQWPTLKVDVHQKTQLNNKIQKTKQKSLEKWVLWLLPTVLALKARGSRVGLFFLLYNKFKASPRYIKLYLKKKKKITGSVLFCFVLFCFVLFCFWNSLLYILSFWVSVAMDALELLALLPSPVFHTCFCQYLADLWT
jgi:hypothetical protein